MLVNNEKENEICLDLIRRKSRKIEHKKVFLPLKYLSQEKFLFLIRARAPLDETSFKLDERIIAQFRNKEIIDFDFFFVHIQQKSWIEFFFNFPLQNKQNCFAINFNGRLMATDLQSKSWIFMVTFETRTKKSKAL